MQGLLIDYQFCSGCHACETACKVEHGYKTGEYGIQVFQMGPREIAPDVWEYTHIPVPTKLCDMCAERVGAGKMPACVHHCQALIIESGDVDDLAKRIDKKTMILYSVTD